jgi:hypothetical protein
MERDAAAGTGAAAKAAAPNDCGRPKEALAFAPKPTLEELPERATADRTSSSSLKTSGNEGMRRDWGKGLAQTGGMCMGAGGSVTVDQRAHTRVYCVKTWNRSEKAGVLELSREGLDGLLHDLSLLAARAEIGAGGHIVQHVQERHQVVDNLLRNFHRPARDLHHISSRKRKPTEGSMIECSMGGESLRARDAVPLHTLLT